MSHLVAVNAVEALFSSLPAGILRWLLSVALFTPAGLERSPAIGTRVPDILEVGALKDLRVVERFPFHYLMQ